MEGTPTAGVASSCQSIAITVRSIETISLMVHGFYLRPNSALKQTQVLQIRRAAMTKWVDPAVETLITFISCWFENNLYVNTNFINIRLKYIFIVHNVEPNVG